MLLLWLLLLLLLLPPLAMLWQQRSQDARPSWLISIQHQMTWGALGWAAAWQQRKLKQRTLHLGRSQQQALMWCLKRAQGLGSLPKENTGVFPAPGGGGPKRKNSPQDSQSLEPKGPFTYHQYTVSWPRALPQPMPDSCEDEISFAGPCSSPHSTSQLLSGFLP